MIHKQGEVDVVLVQFNAEQIRISGDNELPIENRCLCGEKKIVIKILNALLIMT